MQISAPEGRKASSPRANFSRGFSTPTRTDVKRQTIVLGWTFALLSSGSARTIALTVRGAICRNSPRVASPSVPTLALQRIFDTENGLLPSVAAVLSSNRLLRPLDRLSALRCATRGSFSTGEVQKVLYGVSHGR